MSRTIGALDGRLVPYARNLVSAALRLSRRAVVTSTLRTRAEQTRLFKAASRSKYPAARPGTSLHERGLAFDIGGLTVSQLRRLGRLWESWGGRWGGRFRDPIHFEAGIRK